MSKQQRRKGNAKNASSAAAHNYLAQGATFVGLTPEINIFEAASSNRMYQVSEIDDETRIIMKKLTKKDIQTREKGLKELIELTTAESSSIENNYDHFCRLVPQLATDSNPTVRMLTMKAIALFLIKLKKSAVKGLKKIIPMVLFAKSDATNGVSAAASAVIRDGFDADKKKQIIQLFGPNTFEMAASIAQSAHDLSAPIEYDVSEDREARKSRLETQALNVFLAHIKEYGDECRIWEEPARKIFANLDYVKKVFAGNKESFKVQLLNLCYKFSDNVDVMLSIPCIVPYILNTLDVQTFTSECATAWEGIILLMQREKFQLKVSLQKRIYPRFLNVIRRKGNHWRILKNFLLPAVAVLLQELKNPSILISIFESFTDNLPWNADASLNAVNCWFSTFSDFVRWSFNNDYANAETLKVVIPIVESMAKQSILFSTVETAECITSLIHWIFEKNLLLEDEKIEFIKSIETIIIESGSDKCRLFKDALTMPGKHLELSCLHAHLLSHPDLIDFDLIKSFSRSEPIYFDSTTEKITDFSFLENTENFDLLQAGDVVKLIIRIQEKKDLNIEIKNDHIGRHLLLTENPKLWERLLYKVPTNVFQDMINYWHEKRNGKAIAQAVNILKKMGINLDTNKATENVDFLISLIATSENESDEKNELVLKLFAALFESEDEPKQEHFDMLKAHLTVNFDPDHFFEKLFTNCEENEIEQFLEFSARFDKLMSLYEDDTSINLASKLLLSEKSYHTMSAKLQFLELDVLTFSKRATLVTSSLKHPIKQLEEHEAKKMIKEFGRISLFNLASKYHNCTHQIIGWQIIRVITAFSDRYCLQLLDDELKSLQKEIERRVLRSDNVSKLITLNQAPNFLADLHGISAVQEQSFYGMDKSHTGFDIIFKETESPLEYLMSIYDAVKVNGAFKLFQFDHSCEYDWIVNLKFAKTFIEYGGNIFGIDNSEFRDFALCGIITILDNSTDVLTDSPRIFEEVPLLETLTTLYMELFLILSEATENEEHNEQNIEEWNEFYAPTIYIYFIRMFRAVRKDQQPTPFIRTLLKVLLAMPKFPTDVPNDAISTSEFIPELASFKYPPFEESCISQAFNLFTSNHEHIQLIGYAVAKLLMPIMFTRENGTALKARDDAVMTVNRSKLSLPIMLQKCYPDDHRRPHVGPLLLDLALMPLLYSETNLSQENRAAYCDTIDPFFKNALNALMLAQPFDFIQIPISCRIPALQERNYYLTTDLVASPVFFDKFAARLLFKAITILPAAVRLFYKAMANCFMPMFQETVTKFASKLLIEQELAKVREANFDGEMKVRTVPVTGEIIAEYVIEETKMKLTIGLPPDYPLSVPTMTLDKAIVKSDSAKKWLLQLNAYLFHQNGAILEGIEMWKRNVDKGVEGVEDCTICMMTVHQQTHQLPKVKCKQCKNKFHSNCLYKWFESSNQSTCPLCRNNFT